MTNQISFWFLKSFIYFISHRNTSEIGGLTEDRGLPGLLGVLLALSMG